MKFDFAVINPPYGGTGNPMYLQITREAVLHADTAVSLIPSSWIDSLKVKNPSQYTPYRRSLPLCGFEDISTEINVTFLGAAIATNLCICTFHAGSERLDILRLAFRKYARPDIAESIFRKCCMRPSIESRILVSLAEAKEKPGRWYVYIAGIRGNKGTWDWLTFSAERYMKPLRRIPDDVASGYVAEFSSESGAQRFIDYLNTDFAMFCLSLVKMNCNLASGECDYVPYMPGFGSDEKTIERYFSLTKDEADCIHLEMSGKGYKSRPAKESEE